MVFLPVVEAVNLLTLDCGIVCALLRIMARAAESPVVLLTSPPVAVCVFVCRNVTVR